MYDFIAAVMHYLTLGSISFIYERTNSLFCSVTIFLSSEKRSTDFYSQ